MKVKGEPGPYVPIEEVERRLNVEIYGIYDLVDIELFHTEHYARDAITSGKLKFNKINSKAYVVSRDAILDYWTKHRSEPYDPPVNAVSIKLNLKEADFVSALIQYGKKMWNRDFSKDDVFRNMIQKLMGEDIKNHPYLFQT